MSLWISDDGKFAIDWSKVVSIHPSGNEKFPTTITYIGGDTSRWTPGPEIWIRRWQEAIRNDQPLTRADADAILLELRAEAGMVRKDLATARRAARRAARKVLKEKESA